MGAKVRFTEERLSILTTRDRQGLAGRIGVTQTDGRIVRKPTVCFPTDGVKRELRLFRVDPNHLELVENAPRSEVMLDDTDSENHASLTAGTTDEATMIPNGDAILSQSEMDNLFD